MGRTTTNKHALAAVGRSLLDELVRDGARQMLGVALQAEVAAYVEAFADQVDGAGHRAEREVATAAGVVPVRRRGSTTCHPGRDRRAEAVLLRDPAGVGQEVTAGRWGAAAAVPARLVQLQLRSGVGAVPGASTVVIIQSGP